MKSSYSHFTSTNKVIQIFLSPNSPRTEVVTAAMHMRSARVILFLLYTILASTTLAEVQSYHTKRTGKCDVCVEGITR